MTAEKKQRSYRFATEAQWKACISTRVDGDALRTGAIRPLAPFAHPGVLHKASGAHAPAVTRAGEILWADEQDALYRMVDGDEEPMRFAAPTAITHATRMVATSSGLWVLSASRHALESYDEESLTRRLVVDLPDVTLVDIASDGRDSVFVLIEDHDGCSAIRVDHGGRIVEMIGFRGVSDPAAFVFLRRSKRFVVQTDGRQQLLTAFAAGEEKPLSG